LKVARKLTKNCK